MKRFGAVLLAALLLLGLPSCGTGETSTPADASAAAQKSTPTPEISADASALTAGCEEFSGVFSPFFAETTVDRDAAELTQLRLLPNERSGMVLLHSTEGEAVSYNETEYTYYGPADLTIAEQADGTVWYDISLRDDICFSDGTALTIDDLIFSLYVLCDTSYDGLNQLGTLPIQGLDTYRSGGAASISGIQRMGDYSLRIIIEQVDQRTLYTLSEVCIAPLHYYGDAAAYDYANEQFGFTKGDLSIIRTKNDAPLGAGPYRFTSYAGGTITYTANEHYYRGTPATAVLRLYGLSTMEQLTWPDKVRTGELSISYFDSGRGLMDAVFEQAVGNELTRQYVYDTGGVSYEYIGIDPERVCVDSEHDSDASKSLRRGLAVILAACRMTGLEQARQLGLDNLYAIADYPISATTWLVPGKDDASYRTAYDATDLTTAKQIALSCFDNAGYIVSDEAVIAAPEEASCSFEVRVMAYPDGEDGKTVCDPVYLTLLEAQSVFAELGITLDVVNTYALDNPFPQRGDSDMWASVWSQVDITGWSQEYGVQPPLYTFVDPGIQLNAVYASNGGANRYGFSDPELEEMLTEANAATDLNVRKELYQNCLERVIDWAVEVPLYQSQGSVVFNNELIDATTFPADLTASYSWLREVEHISLN